MMSTGRANCPAGSRIVTVTVSRASHGQLPAAGADSSELLPGPGRAETEARAVAGIRPGRPVRVGPLPRKLVAAAASADRRLVTN